MKAEEALEWVNHEITFAMLDGPDSKRSALQWARAALLCFIAEAWHRPNGILPKHGDRVIIVTEDDELLVVTFRGIKSKNEYRWRGVRKGVMWWMPESGLWHPRCDG